MKAVKGFTLIELMIVITIIGILASVSLPNYSVYTNRAEVTEAITYTAAIRSAVTEYYDTHYVFPANNEQAGQPAPEKLISNRITSVVIDQGAIHVTLGNKVPELLRGKILTFRPAVVEDSPVSQISWLCGYAEPVPGMLSIGENHTDIDKTLLPIDCNGKR